MSHPLLCPSLLAADFASLGDQVDAVIRGGADCLHCDVMDGAFVPNISFGAPIIRSLRTAGVQAPIDAHLMVQNPERYIADFCDAGADSITIHTEATVHIQRALASIRAHGKQAGIALNPATPITVLDYVLPDIDLILLMSVNPGFGGQRFLSNSIEKITDVRRMIDNSGHSIQLFVDGGIDDTTMPLVIKAGAHGIIMGSALFGHEDVYTRTRNIRTQLNTYCS